MSHEIIKYQDPFRLNVERFLPDPSYSRENMFKRIVRLEYNSTIDELTGAKNRRGFNEVVARALVGRHDPRGSVAYVDLDNFKKVNDTMGHAAGDGILQGFVGFMRESLRKYDVIGRFGGDEFGILLPDSDEQSAANRLEEIRSAFADIYQREKVTTSIGVVGIEGHEAIETLLAHADQAMYEAKKRRNSVVAYSQIEQMTTKAS